METPVRRRMGGTLGRGIGGGAIATIQGILPCGDEVDEGLVVLAPTLRGHRPAGDGGCGPPGPSAPTGGCGKIYRPPWDEGTARRVVVPYGEKSRKGCPFLDFPAPAPERMGIIFRRGAYVAKNTSQAASVENGRPVGAAILCAQSACSFIHLDGFAVKVRKFLAERAKPFQRFRISMNSSPVMVSFS